MTVTEPVTRLATALGNVRQALADLAAQREEFKDKYNKTLAERDQALAERDEARAELNALRSMQ